MNKELAKKIVNQIKSCDIPLNEIAAVIEDIEDLDEKMKMRRKLGNVFGEIYEILRPIEIEYPSLKI
jgi:chaperonin cofactor prefoldin